MVRRNVPAEIPTASMADVAFLLIIFFLVSSFYSVTRGVQFSLPRHDEATVNVEPEASVLVEIAADSSLRVDGRSMGLADVAGYLRP
ncbi:MAG: biopolymer transporter ExbD, partial [Acidobacteria bacterium]